jgi:ElaB/YqjD/DUF883 family membrane-anchored ribosome-binding protein
MNNRNGTTMGQDAGAGLDQRLDHIKESVKGLVDRGEEKVGVLKERMNSAKDQAFTRGNAVLDQANTYIRANPLKAVGIAFGVGYLGMRLFRR